MKKKIGICLFLLAICISHLYAQPKVEPYPITVGFIKTVHISFPSKVKYVDLGSNYLIAGKADETENIVRVKAAYKGFKEETNFSVICEDGSFYTFFATYSDDPDKLYYEMSPVTSLESNRPHNNTEIILKDIQGESPVILNMIIQSVYKRNERDITYLGERKDGIEATMRGMYVHNDIMYFHIQMKNTSNVSYDIDYIKFTIRDKKKLKKQASQEFIVVPVREYNANRVQKVIGHGMYRTVLACNKFTIAPDKILVVEIAEKNGGRNVVFTIKHSDIISASPIKNLSL